MRSNRLRLGVISTARITDAQVRAIKLSNNVELAAVASRDLKLAQDWASKREVPNAFGSYDEMLASDVIDAVYVPLPNGLHKEWSVKAMQQGKHVLCEKPIAGNANEVREMIAASEANGVKLMEAFMYRFHPQMERMMQMLSQGEIGEVRTIRCILWFPAGQARRCAMECGACGRVAYGRWLLLCQRGADDRRWQPLCGHGERGAGPHRRGRIAGWHAGVPKRVAGGN